VGTPCLILALASNPLWTIYVYWSCAAWPSTVPCLESLEILNFDDCILSSVLIADNVVLNREGLQSSACPLLNSLTVSHASPSDVREFMERRSDGGSAIRRVDFRGGAFQWLYDATDLAWVGSRAFIGSLPRYRDDSWILGLPF
jgi:hypothetical protein